MVGVACMGPIRLPQTQLRVFESRVQLMQKVWASPLELGPLAHAFLLDGNTASPHFSAGMSASAAAVALAVVVLWLRWRCELLLAAG